MESRNLIELDDEAVILDVDTMTLQIARTGNQGPLYICANAISYNDIVGIHRFFEDVELLTSEEARFWATIFKRMQNGELKGMFVNQIVGSINDSIYKAVH